MSTGVVAFFMISREMGGVREATQRVLETHPEVLSREKTVGQLQFLTYALVPLSVGMFPHVFQHWLTARSARAFRLTVIAHPLCILIVWLPCVLLGVWATSALMPDGSLVVPAEHPPNSELAIMVEKLTSPLLTGILGAGILAAIMSSLDSQFFCLGTLFTEDIVMHHFGEDRFSERQIILMARGFIVAVVAITYGISLIEPRQVFTLGVWCFSGFTSLFPIVVAALYWKRVTKAGAIACVVTTVIVGGGLFVRSDFGRHGEELIFGMMPVAPMIACSTLALVIVSLMTRPPGESTMERFFPKAL
jgi:SSS family solute:Na+ symporter